MKVMCIDTKPHFATDDPKLLSLLREREHYTVREEVCALDGPGYHLYEISSVRSFRANRFIPLSDIDETEMVRNLQTETA